MREQTKEFYMMSQRKATVSTILAVLEERGVKYELNGSTPVDQVLNDADKKTIRDSLFAMFRGGQIEMAEESKARYQDDKELKAYVSGLVNNWIRKAKEFNNGTAYIPKNPGSRAGAGDEQIKEMKKLLSLTTDPATKATIEAAIADRQVEIKPLETGIDFDKLPQSLRSKLNI
jgi:hypothetical protein